MHPLPSSRLAVCYVLRSFPEPSETFIADEMLSVQAQGVDVRVLQLNESPLHVVHPSAQRILDQHIVTHMQPPTRAAMLGVLLRLGVRHPVRTLRVLLHALASDQRWAYFHALPQALACLRSRVDYLHAHFADLNAVIARAISAWTGIPYGITTHSYDINTDPLAPSVTADLLQQATVVVTISQFNKHYMVQKYGLAPERIAVVHCGIDLSRFPYVEQRSFNASGVLRLLNVGRLVPAKGQEVLLHAIRLLCDRGVPVQLDIIGAGARHDELLRLRADLGLEECVTFLGAQPQTFVQQRLAAADIFVMSSHTEGLPVACIEAMATGTPTISTRITGMAELIEDGHSGLLVEFGDASALADAVVRLQSQPSLLRDMRVQGRRVVEHAFEREACTQDLLALWRSAVAPQPAARCLPA